ncbi:hypothetical protein HQ576_17380, partial [bacterium]|nr:hypothetical protein [bacterium]
MDGYGLLYLLLAVGAPLLVWRLLKRRGTRLGGLGLRGRMRIVRPQGGGRLAFRRWSWHPILGLLVVLAALAVGVWQPEWLGIPLAVAALIPAALFALPRQGIVIDRQRAAVKRWWGLLVPMISTRIEHVTFHAVIITGEKRATLFREWNVHEVSLSIPGEASAVIETDCTPDRAWELAMALARFLEVPLMDYVAEPSVTLMPRTLAASLRERVAQGRVTLALPDAPPRTHARQTVTEESLAFAVRPAGVWLRRLCALALAAGVPAAVLLLTDQLEVLRAYDAV